ncbi:hypothetical protein [Saccharothrix longispora]|uniref:hypothetical protein n=1 Tax=Saccharothrix longispora TaxID=33920 RepID=UPI0028FD0483|nr:hypothetical protein [Saccharothrix longispora]MBY8851129.1 hypothetical protein [Saccharothrix sp. MB29]MDU0287868.1 hypothetical protein [Saccharothrix longispora]
MKHDLGATITVMRRRTDVIAGSVLSAVVLLVLVLVLLNPHPAADLTGQLVFATFGMLAWPGVLAAVHPRVEVRERGLVVVNRFTKSHVPWSAIDEVVVSGLGVVAEPDVPDVPDVPGVVGVEAALRLRDGRRLTIAAAPRDGRRVNTAAVPAAAGGSVTGLRRQARMKRVIEEHRRDDPDGDGRVRTRLDLWPLPFVATWAALLVIGWSAMR